MEYVINNTGVKRIAVFMQPHPKRHIPTKAKIVPRFTGIKTVGLV